MPSADRRARAEHRDALIVVVIAEILFATGLVVWSISPIAASEAPFGPAGSRLIVVAVMVALAAGAVLTGLSARTSRRTRIATVVLLWLTAIAAWGLAIASQLTGAGLSYLLFGGAFIMLPLLRAAHRVVGAPPASHDSTGRKRP
ncbi:hypothetical protein M8C13_22890 [Crossiella sp. SN42]|uniref:hypothetical protein n=1 Tax=Crossiella sp. SN42 TaxID=2944808 RepID=UPI00207CAC38|nr:hypothetical protein [Crossiella sp. SN42]MCO1578605.1 hypothetical protein [Crossiella sp. SN42]